MFVPRKLQKRTHPNRKAQSSAQVTDANFEASHSQLLSNNDGEQADQGRSSSSNTSSNAPARLPEASPAESAKLDRLVEFLFARLSPLYLALAAQEERQQPGPYPYTELVRLVTRPSSATNSRYAAPMTHLARILDLISGLATRCKSISLLLQAMGVMQEGAAAGWLVLHQDRFQIEWSLPFVRVLHRLSAGADASLSESLAPLLLYIEGVPPCFKTRAQAAAYVVGLLRKGTDHSRGAAVLSVLKPIFVERHLMADVDGLPSASALEERWISGRGFFLLSCADTVELLCSMYKWDSADRKAASGSPIRCLSWTGWEELKRLDLDEQQHAKAERITTANVGNGDDSTDPKPMTEESWYRGTILLLPLPAQAGSQRTITLPSFSAASELTPAVLSRQLKPQLEKRVPESVSYIHTLSSAASVAIRTSHRKRAAQLLSHFPELAPMEDHEEHEYWTKLPDKVRLTAKKRILALDQQLSSP